MTDSSVNRVAPVSRGARVSLVAVLAVVLLGELWLNRVAARLTRSDAELLGIFHRIDPIALFFFELASVLATALLLLALGRVILSPSYRGPLRLSYALVGGVVGVLAFAGVWMRLPVRLEAHLHTSAMFLMLIIALATISTPALKRLRIGIVALMVPILCVTLANLLQRFSPPGLLDPRASMLAELGGATFVVVGLVAPMLFVPSGVRGPLAPMLGGVVLALGLVLSRVDWSLTARLAGMGVGVAVPVGDWGMPLYVFGAAAYAYTIGGLLWWPGPDRLRGVGLLIVCLIGLQLELPYQVAASLVGFLCLLESASRPGPSAITRAVLDHLLQKWATLVGSAHVNITGPDGREHARVDFDLGGKPGRFGVERRASAIARVELTIGEHIERAPPVTIVARDALGLGPAAQGPIVATDDARFDQRFVVRDHRSASTALLDAPTRERLLRWADGWVGVWPQRGARFVGRAVPSGDEGLPALAQLLADLAQRT